MCADLTKTTAPVNKIIRFSSVDGPGNRTAIFLQGCNFDCKYCHNPETRKLCIACGDCVAACPAGALTLCDVPVEEREAAATVPAEGTTEAVSRAPLRGTAGRKVLYDPAKCVACDTCIKTCKHDASPRICYMTPEEVMTEVRKQIPYIRGITVSGGECSLYPRFCTELFTLAKKEGLTCFLDSNGSYDFSKDPELMEVTDAVMLDIKAFSASDHQRVTGTENAMVLQNAVYLAEQGKLFEVRTVVAPDLFHTEDTVRRTGELLLPFAGGNSAQYGESREHLEHLTEKKLPCGENAAAATGQSVRYKLITYRPMGVLEAYRNMTVPTGEQMEHLRQILRDLGWQDIQVV